jgi:hypothetical protein
MSANHEEPNIRCVERAKQIAKILDHRSVELPWSWSEDSFTGIFRREYDGSEALDAFHASRDSSLTITNRSVAVLPGGAVAASELRSGTTR